MRHAYTKFCYLVFFFKLYLSNNNRKTQQLTKTSQNSIHSTGLRLRNCFQILERPDLKQTYKENSCCSNCHTLKTEKNTWQSKSCIWRRQRDDNKTAGIKSRRQQIHRALRADKVDRAQTPSWRRRDESLGIGERGCGAEDGFQMR